ncbi:putative leader peptide [Streptacidiphilus albus]
MRPGPGSPQPRVRSRRGPAVHRSVGSYSRRHIDLQRSSSALCPVA